MAGPSLRVSSLPRFALRRDEAAASLAISPSLFDLWIKQGRMPEGKRVGGVMLWDVEAIRAAWQGLNDADERKGEDEGENPFDHLVA